MILKGSPNKEAAMQLVTFMTRPENQKRLPSIIPLGVTNKEAIAISSSSVSTPGQRSNGPGASLSRAAALPAERVAPFDAAALKAGLRRAER